MLDRASTFADPTIVKLLKNEFVSAAIDQKNQRRQQDTEGEFYRKIAGDGPRNNFNGTTQGLYVADASGQFLGYSNHRSPDRILKLLTDSLSKHAKKPVAEIQDRKIEARYDLKVPEGGLNIRVQARILGGYEPTDNHWQQLFQNALSRDNLWLSAAEHRQLANGVVAKSVQMRIAKFHLVDNTRGEPPMWKDQEVEHVSMTIKDGVLTGGASLKTADGKRGYNVNLKGRIETNASKVTRFDVVALGQFWGEGRYTANAPKGKFPLAISFTLADGSDIADSVPPQAARGWLAGYLP